MEKININKSALLKALEAKHFTVAKLAKHLGMANSTMAHIVKDGANDVKCTSVENMKNIAKALGVSLKSITEGKPFEMSGGKVIEKGNKKAPTKKAEAKPKIAKTVKEKVAVEAKIAELEEKSDKVEEAKKRMDEILADMAEKEEQEEHTEIEQPTEQEYHETTMDAVLDCWQQLQVLNTRMKAVTARLDDVTEAVNHIDDVVNTFDKNLKNICRGLEFVMSAPNNIKTIRNPEQLK
ncbi:helix-turn-helix domain-containing protein [Phascolarctobacterium sp.]|uniref:helix-turn-helix domain-containing protein n=1 Tax=Phascolarctobacterium sp. TaxID=2049039 RepID=UPI0038637F96